MVKIKSFTDLTAWQKSHLLVVTVYKITKKFSQEELCGLTNQMRQCAVSITSNLAEGFTRQSFKEKIQFYAVTQGSTAELQSQLLISRDIGYLTKEIFNKLAAETVIIHKLITGLIKKSKTMIHYT